MDPEELLLMNSGAQTNAAQEDSAEDQAIIGDLKQTQEEAATLQGKQAEESDQEGDKGAEQTSPKTPTFESLLSETYEGKFKSKEDLDRIIAEREEFYEKVQNYKPHEYKSPMAKAIDEYVAQGGKDVNGFIRAQSLEPDKMDDKTAIITWETMNKPHLSPEDVKLLVESDYPELSEEDLAEMTDQEIRLHNIRKVKMKDAAHQARESLTGLKRDLTTPTERVDPKIQKAREDYQKAMKAAVGEYKGITVPGETPYTFPAEDTGKIAEIAQNLTELWKAPTFTNKDGSVNFEHLFNVIQFALNPGAMKSMANEYHARAVTSLKNEMQNKTTGKPDGGDNGKAKPVSNWEAQLQILNS